MSLELLMLGNVPIGQMVERAKLAEANGYDTLWVADERFYREVYSCLAVLALHTTRVRLGTCVTDPFARHPALTAMAIATLDEISSRRAVLGVGAGISGFSELSIVRRKPAVAMREMIEMVRSLLRGEPVDYKGEVVSLANGKLSFKPGRADIPVYVASNGPLGQRMTGGIADGAIMEGCGSVEEVGAFREVLAQGARKRGRDPGAVKVVARLNACVSTDGRKARDAVRPFVARMLAAGRLKFMTAEKCGLTLPAEAIAPLANVAYAAGAAPYAPLLPLITDRHVDAFTLSGTADEIVDHMAALKKAGIDSFIIMPFAPEGGTAEETLVQMGSSVWPRVQKQS
ncbi:MAG: LLM class flavin-dependent oxidoreductase [Reyranella sp.]|uniref:LLM class flavin-dependent oxidoreductase n=1 Tax=Reyranella sp. TaxID=1929291 RepID=UPI003D129A62